MLILWLCIIIPLICILIKLILNFISKKYGKLSYDGFSAAGFAYNKEKDIFYSVKNAWQKNFGYTHMYDVLAPVFRMIVDTEPVRFYYDNKNWLITFWKGQYGIVTGAEVGVYYTKQKKVNKKTVYMPVEECDMLKMHLILYKNGKVITKVKARHWWLAVFKLGMFSKPKELTMDVAITFPNSEMLNAFLASFKKIGYKSKDYIVIGNTFCFKFIKPRTRKVWTRIWFIDAIRQFFNRKNTELYNKYLGDLIETKKNDKKKLIMVKDFIPDILKNSKDDKHSKKVSKKIINDIEKNVIFLDSRVYPGTRIIYYE